MNLREFILEITLEKLNTNFLKRKKKQENTRYIEKNEKQIGFILYVLRQMTDASKAKSINLKEKSGDLAVLN